MGKRHNEFDSEPNLALMNSTGLDCQLCGRANIGTVECPICDKGACDKCKSLMAECGCCYRKACYRHTDIYPCMVVKGRVVHRQVCSECREAIDKDDPDFQYYHNDDPYNALTLVIRKLEADVPLGSFPKEPAKRPDTLPLRRADSSSSGQPSDFERR